MARYSYMIPRETKGEGKILMIFSKKSFLWTLALAGIGFVTIYPIFAILGLTLVGYIGIALFGLIGFLIGTIKMPSSQNFEIFRKTGGEDIDVVLMRLVKFKKKGKKVYTYYTGGKENE